MPQLQTNCSGSSYTISVPQNQGNYQWQQSNNNGPFTDINNGSDFNGVNTASLQINQAILASPQYIYRCVINGVPQKPVLIQITNVFLGTIDDKWSNPLNWNCQVLPVEGTTVLLQKDVIIDMPAEVKQIIAAPGIRIQVAPGVKLLMRPTPPN